MEASSKLARPYAIAAFNQAQQEGDLGAWSQMLATLTTIVSDPTAKGLLANPKVDNKQLAGLVIAVAGEQLSTTGQNFVRVLAQYGRLGLMSEIQRQYEEARAQHEKRTVVQVTAAFALSDQERSLIGGAMARRMGTEVDLNVEVDASLIGGCIIRAGDLVIDGSLRGRVAKLAQALA